MQTNDPRWKVATENNPVLLRMEKDCLSALTSVKGALKVLKGSPLAKGRPGSVGPEAVTDLITLQKMLEGVVGSKSPFIWGIIDPDRE